MEPETIEDLKRRVAAAERRAAEARENAGRLAEEARQLVARCFALATGHRHQSADDVKRARSGLAEARDLLERAEKLTR
jgi:vacuolar-type H+-ATPase subunit H